MKRHVQETREALQKEAEEARIKAESEKKIQQEEEQAEAEISRVWFEWYALKKLLKEKHAIHDSFGVGRTPLKPWASPYVSFSFVSNVTGVSGGDRYNPEFGGGSYNGDKHECSLHINKKGDYEIEITYRNTTRNKKGERSNVAYIEKYVLANKKLDVSIEELVDSLIEDIHHHGQTTLPTRMPVRQATYFPGQEYRQKKLQERRWIVENQGTWNFLKQKQPLTLTNVLVEGIKYIPRVIGLGVIGGMAGAVGGCCAGIITKGRLDTDLPEWGAYVGTAAGAALPFLLTYLKEGSIIRR